MNESAAYTLTLFISDIQNLKTNVDYEYISGRNACQLISVNEHDGSIEFRRKGKSKTQRITAENVKKLVDALNSRQAIDINNVLSDSGNSRAVLETLVAHTPNIFWCKPGNSKNKHIYWDPERCHPNNQIEEGENPPAVFKASSVSSLQNKGDGLGLIVGMRSQESPPLRGTVTIIDDDDYCYQVLAEGDGDAQGIRTISKVLLKEWIEAVNASPNETAVNIRKSLTGKSDIDSFEYGNAAVLYKLSKLALGQLDYTLEDVRKYSERRVGRAPRAESYTDTRLTTALMYFASHRTDVANGSGKSYDELARQTREFYKNVDGDKLVACNYAEFRKGLTTAIVANTIFSKHTEDDKRRLGDFLADVRRNPKDFSDYLMDPLGVPGIGTDGPVLTNFLMRARPDLFATYSKQVHSSLQFLGATQDSDLPELTADSYTTYKDIQTKILDAMRKLGIKSEEGFAPDYATVNEFTWFVDKNHEQLLKLFSQNAIEGSNNLLSAEAIEQLNLSAFIDSLNTDVIGANLFYPVDLVRRFVCALLAKPFVVLTGLSGSGKTKLAQAFTSWIATKGTSLLVPVGADWTNSEHLLGYPDALQPDKYVMPDTGVLKLLLDAHDHPDLPFFLILDEMNLSHVERYFADFLSAMESGDEIKLYDGDARKSGDTEVPRTLKIPANLFVIGTMNVDETTYMFSPKVLDRAQVIEFRVSSDDMNRFLAEPLFPDLDKVKGNGARYAVSFLLRKGDLPSLDDTMKKDITDELNKFFPELAALGAEFGYRTASEILRFCAYDVEAGEATVDAVDAAIVQKLLPKLHGSQARLAPVLKKLHELASSKELKLTLDKISRMQERLKANGFASFAEA